MRRLGNLSPLQLHVWSAIGAGVVLVAAAVPRAVAAGPPPLWRLALAALALVAGDMVLLHLRFGHDQHSFTWSEAAVIIGLVALPSPWLPLTAVVSIAVAHLVARRALLKVAFNATSFAAGCVLASTAHEWVIDRFGGHDLAHPARWAALAAAALVFFAWNNTTVAGAIAFSQGVRFGTVFSRGLRISLLVWFGNTVVGVLLVSMAASKPSMLLIVPPLATLLYIVYRGYLRAMQERDTWKVLQAASRDLVRTDRTELASVVLERAGGLFDADLAELVLVGDVADGATVFRRAGGDVERNDGDLAALAGTWWGRMACEQEPFEIHVSRAPAAQRTELESLGLAMCVVAPLVTPEGCIGALRIGFRGKVRLASRELQVFTTFVNHVATAVQNERLFEEMRSQALHDPLTGLPNRTLLLERLRHGQLRGQRRGTSVAVLFLDLDRFKVINDSLGHHFGDQLLVEVARRVSETVRPGDTATRFGGDEFVVLCQDLLGEGHALDVADRLVSAFDQPFVVAGEQVFLTASVGVAISAGPEDDPVALVRDADAAMYRAKAKGRARCEVFDQEMRAAAIDRLETENDLRRAIDRGELRLVFQPTVDVATQRVIGAEALVRWDHPTRGLVEPGAFIPLAEETGLIHPLGRWVLMEACQQLAAWSVELRPHDQLSVAVNLSPHQLGDPGLVDQVAATLASTGADPGRLVLEVTESALLEDADAALEVLERLRALGVHIALDDFGTGWSSLSYLNRLPADVLKIDRSFVGRLGGDRRDRSLVAGMIDLAHALDLLVVAEGVETPSQLADLFAMGCDVAQGYYFSRPVPAAQVDIGIIRRTADVVELRPAAEQS
jgi:diguanylate cyclase (GGDEF)-like protein